MKNYGLKPHKLGDKIVLDGIDAINKLQHETGLPGFISGGMAVSSYLPIENHRETVDLDYTLFFNGGVIDYKKITEHLTRTLIEKDYSIEYRKKGTTHDYLVKRHEDSLLIQHPRKSSNHFIKNKKFRKFYLSSFSSTISASTAFSSFRFPLLSFFTSWSFASVSCFIAS